MPQIVSVTIVCQYCDHTIMAHTNKDTDAHNQRNLEVSIGIMKVHEEREHGTVSR